MNQATAPAIDDTERQREAGFGDPVAVLTVEECDFLLRHWSHVRNRQQPGWHKSRWQADRVLYDIATKPEILGLVRQWIGNDIALWGVSVVTRNPGRVHPWHSDVESSFGEGFVSVWIGLEGACRQAGLKFIPGSQHYGKLIQQAAFEAGEDRDALDDDRTLDLAREHDPDARLVQPVVADGEAVPFDGRIWHGSHNESEARRVALLLQYAEPSKTVRQPLQARVVWPLEFEETLPPVTVVSGEAGGIANPVSALPPAGRYSSDSVGSVFRQLAFPLQSDPERGWRPHVIARGVTPNLGTMSVHASVLDPGRTPHPPHAHVEEEILMVLDGEAEILICDGPDSSSGRPVIMRPGAFVYYPAYQYHTIHNRSARPVTYLMFKWSGPPVSTEGQAETGVTEFGRFPIPTAAPPAKGYHTQKVLEAPTACLEKLQAHLTTMPPGAAYRPHSDDHDVAIVLLEGEVTANGNAAGPGSVFYFAAGEMHDMENTGNGTARYLVFEFHASAPDFARRPDRKPKAKTTDRNRRKSWPKRAFGAVIRWLTSPLTRKIERVVDRRIARMIEAGELSRPSGKDGAVED